MFVLSFNYACKKAFIYCSRFNRADVLQSAEYYSSSSMSCTAHSLNDQTTIFRMKSCDTETYNLETHNLEDAFQFQPLNSLCLSTLIHHSSQ